MDEHNPRELSGCLQRVGYTVSPAPSLQSFIDSYPTDPWMPFGETMMTISGSGQDALVELYATCTRFTDAMWD